MNNAIVLTLDRLPGAYLGPYGNTWIDTPGWNRLAADSVVVEHALTDTLHLDSVYRSYWRGLHALTQAPLSPPPALPAWLSDHGVETWLVTDEPAVAELGDAAEFDRRLILPADPSTEPADQWQETQTARLFASALDALDQARPPYVAWVHARANSGPWDAPYALRTRLADPDDPVPPDFVQPPDLTLAADFDPDLILGVQQAFAAQVAVIDACLDVLLDTVGRQPDHQRTAIVATAPRGLALGEHLRIGPSHLHPYGELAQVPWLMHWPGLDATAIRYPHLVQPPDLYPSLIHWCTHRLPDVPVWGRSLLPGVGGVLPGLPDQAVTYSPLGAGLRTPNWQLITDRGAATQLFVKPDDRWEVNDVATRCPDVVESLDHALAGFRDAAQCVDRLRLTCLPDDLRW